MTWIWIVVYAAGFMATARVATVLDRRFDLFRGYGDEPVMVSLLWPAFLVAAALIAPFALLYWLATRGIRR